MDRLTEKTENGYVWKEDKTIKSSVEELHYMQKRGIKTLNKLGQLEDLMEKYEISSVEALEEIIKDYDDMAKSIVEFGLGTEIKIKENKRCKK